MAALCVCDDFLLLTNGQTNAVIHFRSPTETDILDVASSAQAGSCQKSVKRQKHGVQLADMEETGDDREDRLQSNNFTLACTISSEGEYIAVCDDSKSLHVYKVEDRHCALYFSCRVSRRCTAVRFTKNKKEVIVADKSGDVYAFDLLPLRPQETAETTETGNCQVSLDENPKKGVDSLEGTLKLGHLSMLLDLLMVENDKLLVTCDRDEKIRISRYPDSYNIEAYCLGHTEFVSSLAYDGIRKVIMSGSGDATVRLWKLDGQELYCRNILEDVTDAQVKYTCDDDSPANFQALDVPSSKQVRHQAIQQITYSSTCQMLFVCLYRSPHVLVYKLMDSESSDQPTLKFVTDLCGSDNAVSICVHRCVLWLVRQSASALQVSAYRINSQTDDVERVQDDGSTESLILQTLANQAHILAVPPSCLDLFPFLWKCTFQEELPSNLKQQKAAERGKKIGGKREREK